MALQSNGLKLKNSDPKKRAAMLALKKVFHSFSFLNFRKSGVFEIIEHLNENNCSDVMKKFFQRCTFVLMTDNLFHFFFMVKS